MNTKCLKWIQTFPHRKWMDASKNVNFNCAACVFDVNMANAELNIIFVARLPYAPWIVAKNEIYAMYKLKHIFQILFSCWRTAVGITCIHAFLHSIKWSRALIFPFIHYTTLIASNVLKQQTATNTADASLVKIWWHQTAHLNLSTRKYEQKISDQRRKKIISINSLKFINWWNEEIKYFCLHEYSIKKKITHFLKVIMREQ